MNLVRDGKADIVAGVVGLLDKEAAALDAKILPGHFMTVPQAIALPLNRTTDVGAVVRFLNEFVKRNLDFVAEKIKVDLVLQFLFLTNFEIYAFMLKRNSIPRKRSVRMPYLLHRHQWNPCAL